MENNFLSELAGLSLRYLFCFAKTREVTRTQENHMIHFVIVNILTNFLNIFANKIHLNLVFIFFPKTVYLTNLENPHTARARSELGGWKIF